ncbi:hypothetical protein [Caenispirillum salinarum]|uniref:hypothetical protein n=1 Tax=Caenispirillum salinarum TaxID=859058 RepID=UPI00384E7883
MQATTTNATRRLVMREAWAIARRGAAVFGGSVCSYLSEALRIAWKEVRGHWAMQAFDGLIAAGRKARQPPPLKTKPAAGYWRHANPARFDCRRAVTPW